MIAFKTRLKDAIYERLKAVYPVALADLDMAPTPDPKMGDLALTFPFQLAKTLKRPPRTIAQEAAPLLASIEGIAKAEVAGGGFLNLWLDKAAVLAEAVRTAGRTSLVPDEGKIIIEHTNINPNKAAHIGHLRNACLGDTLARCLRYKGERVEVQNYIDDTGVQVVDVVFGFLELEGKTIADLEKLPGKFDYYCWDLYARVSAYLPGHPEAQGRKSEIMKRIEHGLDPEYALSRYISRRIVRAHLATMARLGIAYDVLPCESTILHLKFWEKAFALLKERGAITLAAEGDNKGCWVMRLEGEDEREKIIVRSDGTVTYVGKDIAYHLWKFGLLGRDFGYRRFFRYPNGHEVWISAEQGEAEHPHFGGVEGIYNVIDARQNEAQNTVVDALRALGYDEQAARYTHFSYEMVALTPRCAIELGYVLSEDDMGRPFVEVSGRKGFGVKADDLLDKLTAAAQREVDVRHPERKPEERAAIATQIAVGALRYFMLKFTKMSVIAFDFKDALSFEGETGPYAQYAAVRASSIFRKAGTTAEQFLSSFVETQHAASLQQWLAEDDMWELWLTAAKLESIVEQCIATTEPAYAAKYAFQLAQHFSNFYHRHHILTEADEGKKKFLMATAAVARRELVRVLELMGITVPPVM